MEKSNKELRTNERECLEAIKDSYFCHGNLVKDFDNADPVVISNILSTATHNEKHSIFPDFFFNGGIIEHFEISSSLEDKKGSQYRKEVFENKKAEDVALSAFFERTIEHDEEPITFTSFASTTEYKCFSYQDFIKSFKKNVDKHLSSLRKSRYLDGIVVFLIELSAGKLHIKTNGKFHHFYKLSEDKNLLLYIKNNIESVNYIIFKNFDTYEIIDVSKIDSIISKAKDDLDIQPATFSTISFALRGD